MTAVIDAQWALDSRIHPKIASQASAGDKLEVDRICTSCCLPRDNSIDFNSLVAKARALLDSEYYQAAVGALIPRQYTISGRPADCDNSIIAKLVIAQTRIMVYTISIYRKCNGRRRDGWLSQRG
jgi:hypothetical protein